MYKHDFSTNLLIEVVYTVNQRKKNILDVSTKQHQKVSVL